MTSLDQDLSSLNAVVSPLQIVSRAHAPIGVFDSGMGGVSLLRDARMLLPTENFIYYGDNLNAPYGDRTEEEILALTENSADFLLQLGVKALVIACNTATSVAVREMRHRDNIPIIGMGGIASAEDAVEFFLAGASAVAVGTANFTDPEITMKICDGLTDYLAENGFSSIEEIVGKANPGFLGFPKDVQKG